MTDIIDQTRREITERIEELRPVLAEYTRLQAAAKALAEIGATPAGEPAAAQAQAESVPRRRRPGRPRRSQAARPAARKTASSRRRGGRPKGSGSRSAEALTLVEGQPGITIREIAAKMKIAPNYLYRVLPPLEQEGKIVKKGAGWHPAGSTSES